MEEALRLAEQQLGVTLRDAQREVVRFFVANQEAGHGTIVGAEMGLGKTVMAGACMMVMQLLLDADAKRLPILVVAPLATIIDVWEKHLLRWFSAAHVCIYHGPKRNSPMVLKRAKRCRVLVTTYELLSQQHKQSMTKLFRTAPATRRPFNLFAQSWATVFADEAHWIKNLVQFDNDAPDSKKGKLSRKTGAAKAPRRAKALYALRKQMRRPPIAMTGTLLSNSLSDAASVVKWIAPLDTSCSQHPRWADMVVWKREIQSATTRIEKAERVRALLAPCLITKYKSGPDAPLLPKVEYRLMEIPLGGSQLLQSQLLIARGQDELRQFDRALAEPGNKGSTERRKLRNTFMELRQVSETALLPNPKLIADPESIARGRTVEQLLESSCKARATVPLVVKNVVADGGKQVVFCQSRPMLRLLAKCLKSSLPKGQQVLCIDGSIDGDDRIAILTRFRQPHARGHNTLIIMLQCGNVGIDLSAANHVLLLAPAFNAALEQQAIDRVYRFPQSRVVYVVRMIAGRTSIDGYVRQIQQRKLLDTVQVALPGTSTAGFFEGDAFDNNDLPSDFQVVVDFFRTQANAAIES